MELVFYTYFKKTCPLIPYFGRKGFFFQDLFTLTLLTIHQKSMLLDKATRWQNHIIAKMVSHHHPPNKEGPAMQATEDRSTKPPV